MTRSAVGFIVALVLLTFSTTTVLLPCTEAAIIDTPAYLSFGKSISKTDLQTLIVREDVREQLIAYGVDPAAAADRIASLTSEELVQLNQKIDSLPPGSDVLAILGIVLVVLIILELLGVTNVFTRL